MYIVIPALIVVGLVTYALVENFTKYERAKMYSSKALKKLGDRNEGIRKRAYYWLISNGTLEDLKILEGLLKSENPLVRANAAISIGGISKRLNDKSLSKVLIDLYNSEEVDYVKEDIVGALCDIEDEAALEILEKYLLMDHNEILRFTIAESLEDLASPKSVKFLVEVIKGDNTDTLKLACRRALEKIAIKEGTTADAYLKD